MTYPLRMHHPANGWHHVYNDAEEAAHRANGWLPEDATPRATPQAVATVSPAEPAGVAPDDPVQGFPMSGPPVKQKRSKGRS